MFEIHFNIILPITVAGFTVSISIWFVSKIYTWFLFLHIAHSTKCIFLCLMRLRLFVETAYKNIATANK